jgi:hypothetical protein
MSKPLYPQEVKTLLRTAKKNRQAGTRPQPAPITPRERMFAGDEFSPLLVANKRIVELETECAALHRTCQSFHSLLLRHEAREDVLKRELIEERRQIHIPTLSPSGTADAPGTLRKAVSR